MIPRTSYSNKVSSLKLSSLSWDAQQSSSWAGISWPRYEIFGFYRINNKSIRGWQHPCFNCPYIRGADT